MSVDAIQVWSSFALCVAVIAVAGVKLTVYGDAIADKTGMGGTWVGLVLVATVTSLPELASGIAAVTAAEVPDIAVGDALGSCVYNFFILALMDLLRRADPVLSDARLDHVLSAAFGVVTIGIAALGLIGAHLPGGATPLALGIPVGWSTPVLLACYVLAIRTLHRHQERETGKALAMEPDRFPGLTLRQLGVRYGAAAVFVIAAGAWLPYVSADLALLMGWAQSFTGTVFTAMSTSLPELVVTLACLRIGAIDLAVGNILGSNLFNAAILAVDDLFYLQGPILAAVSPVHLVSAVTAMTMSGVAVVGVFYRSRRRILGLGGWASLLLGALFAINGWLVYALSRA